MSVSISLDGLCCSDCKGREGKRLPGCHATFIDGKGNIVPLGYPIKVLKEIEVERTHLVGTEIIPCGVTGIIKSSGGYSELDFFLVVVFNQGKGDKEYRVPFNLIKNLGLACPFYQPQREDTYSEWRLGASIK